MRTFLITCALVACGSIGWAEEATTEVPETASLFHEPIQVQADGQPVATEAPGYAAPTMADVDGDGKADLVVGQFMKGKMHVFKNIGTVKAPKFGKGSFIMCEGEPALVPDVW